MTNEMKLLLAMCDAMGFEVEVDNKFDKEKYDTGVYAHKRMEEISGISTITPPVPADYSETTYKVTKKEVDDTDFECITHLMDHLKKSGREVSTLTNEGKTYIYNDKGDLEIIDKPPFVMMTTEEAKLRQERGATNEDL